MVNLLVIWITLMLGVRLETPLDTNVLTVATWQLYRAPGVSLVTIQPSVLVSRTDSVTTAETCVNVSCKWQLISSELNTPVPVIGFFQESWKAVSFKVFTLKSETAGGSIQYCKLFCLKIPSFLCAYLCLFNFVHMLLFSIINFQNTLTFFHLKIKPIWEYSSFIPLSSPTQKIMKKLQTLQTRTLRQIKYFPLKTKTSAILGYFNLDSLETRTSKLLTKFTIAKRKHDLIERELATFKEKVRVTEEYN